MIKKILNREIISYLIVGGLTTVVSLLSYFFVTAYFLNPKDPIELQIANIISWVLAVLFAFQTNRKYVFRSDNNPIKEMFSFFLARIFTLLIDIFFMFLFVTVLKFDDTIAKLINQVIITVSNYIISKFYVFNTKNR